MHMIVSGDLKVTTAILLKGAFVFAFIDLVYISALSRIVKTGDLAKMKRELLIVMFLFFFILLGSVMSIIFWYPVYSYVFPLWARWIIPPVYGLLFSLIGLLFWWLAVRVRKFQVIIFCLLGGLWGVFSHILAIARGILDRPPMLKGSSPAAALVIAFFEFTFYWCVCLTISRLIFSLRSGKKR